MIWQNKKPSVLSYAEHFWWARVDVASRAAKNSLAGCFCPAGRKAPGRSCSHPPAYVSLTFAQKKTASVSLHQRFFHGAKQTSVYKGYKQDKIEMRGDRAEMSDFPLYLNTVAGGLDRRDQTIGGFSFVVKIYAVPVVEIIGQLLYLLGRYGFNAQFSDCL